ncbi:hypothetical protein [Calorimonas adulescens]|uniref:hypothetical protein n=1 Tax=Calorimonas adulescens TaxID=2606906 RepID=UPI001396999D|nr:hypothetical protein [Calorimonas adulescens]
MWHFFQINATSHTQKASHTSIVLLWIGTAMVGNLSRKVEMHIMHTPAHIKSNVRKLNKQYKELIDFSNDKSIIVSKADWLLEPNYVVFLRDISRHFPTDRVPTPNVTGSVWKPGWLFLNYTDAVV